jgi:hypothetical protein
MEVCKTSLLLCRYFAVIANSEQEGPNFRAGPIAAESRLEKTQNRKGPTSVGPKRAAPEAHSALPEAGAQPAGWSD